MINSKVINIVCLVGFFNLLWMAPTSLSLLRAEESYLSQDKPGQGVGAGEIPPPEVQAEKLDLQQFVENLFWVAQFDAAYSLSVRSGEDNISGGNLSGVLAPAYKIKDGIIFILMYNGDYYQRRDYYSDLIGPRERTEFQSHTITPILRIDFGENKRYSAIPSLFYTRTYNKDVAGGGWDDGLYNYKDKGLGLDFKMRGLGYRGEDGELKLGAQFYQRDYPNYESLLDLATGNAIERDERDYDGLLTRAGYHWGDAIGLAWDASFYLLYKKLEGKKVVDLEGRLTDEGQRDYQQNLGLLLSYVPDMQPGLKLGFELNSNIYRSNQNYYDGRGTFPNITDDVAIPDFYDYNSYLVRLSLSYLLPMMPLTPTLSYTYQQTNYTDRLAKNSLGNYKTEKQEETQTGITLDLRYRLSNRINLYGRWQYLNVHSNNDDESVYTYNYETNTYFAGLTLNY
jgi:hypothetical protein